MESLPGLIKCTTRDVRDSTPPGLIPGDPCGFHPDPRRGGRNRTRPNWVETFRCTRYNICMIARVSVGLPVAAASDQIWEGTRVAVATQWRRAQPAERMIRGGAAMTASSHTSPMWKMTPIHCAIFWRPPIRCAAPGLFVVAQAVCNSSVRRLCAGFMLDSLILYSFFLVKPCLHKSASLLVCSYQDRLNVPAVRDALWLRNFLLLCVAH